MQDLALRNRNRGVVRVRGRPPRPGNGANIVNTATVTGDGATRTATSLGCGCAEQVLHIEKDATVAGGTADLTSDTISYTLAVTNQGNAAIANVVVTDDNRRRAPRVTTSMPSFNGGDTNRTICWMSARPGSTRPAIR